VGFWSPMVLASWFADRDMQPVEAQVSWANGALKLPFSAVRQEEIV